MTIHTSPGAGSSPTTRDVQAFSLCMLIGLVLSMLPHFLCWWRSGIPVWLSDSDDFLYLAGAAQAYFNHPFHLSNPLLVSGGSIMYPWFELGPGILVARALRLNPIYIMTLWAFWAGITIPAGWYLLVRQFISQPWAAASIVIVLLTDVGILSGHLAYGQWHLLARSLLEGLPALRGFTDGLPQWRLITPGLGLGYLLLFCYLLRKAQERGDRIRVLAAGLSFGLLFYVYFYFWTAVLLALAIASLLDERNRRVYVHTAAIGLIVGLPLLIYSHRLWLTASPDWSERTHMFFRVGRGQLVLFPKWMMLVLAFGLFYLRRFAGHWLFMWALALAGLIAMNHNLVTGLDIESFHWLYVWGPFGSLFLLLMIVRQFGPWLRKPIARTLVGILLVIHVVIAIQIRSVLGTGIYREIGLTENYRRYLDQQHAYPGFSWAPNAVIAGEHDLVDIATVVNNLRPLDHEASVVSFDLDDVERIERRVLNAYLQGADLDALIREERVITDKFHGTDRPPALRRFSILGDITSRIDTRFSEALDRYQVRYVALPVATPAPAFLSRDWQLRQSGPRWQVWERL